MNVQVTEESTCLRTIELEIEAEDIEAGISERVKEFRRTRVLPGFRQGRVPEVVIRKRFGKDIREEVIGKMKYEGLGKALDDNDLEIVSDPDIDEQQNEPGKAFILVAKVEVKPHVELVDYKGLKVVREKTPVSDEDVDARLEMIREQRADEVNVEDRPVGDDDTVVVILTEVDPSGLPIIGVEEKERRWQIGGYTSFSEELDGQVKGMSVGDEKTVVYKETDPESSEERGITAKAVVQSIIERQVPELDEEFIKDLGDYETVDDFRTAVREDMEAHADATADRGMITKLREQIVEANEFDVPESMLERYLDRLVENEKRQQQDADEAALREEKKDEAVKEIRGSLALEIIAKNEELTIDDERVNQRIAMMASGYRMPPDALRGYLEESGRIAGIRSDVLEEVVMEFVKDAAEVEEVELEEKVELEKE
jgi:trigger factor